MSDTATQTGAESQAMGADTGAEPQDFDLNRRLSEIIAEQEGTTEAAAKEATGDPGQAQQAKQATEEPARTVKVKVDGEEREVPIDDLVTRYQKESAAEKRFEEAARLRREAEQHGSTVQQERQQLASALQHFVTTAQAMMPARPDPNLLNTDPVEYLRQERVYTERAQQLQQAQAAQAYLTQQQQAEAAARQQADMKASQEALLKALPHWSDGAKASAEQKRIADFMRSVGVPEERIRALSDHRDVIAYRESMLYRDLLAKAKETSKQLTKAPTRVERPGVAGSNFDGRTQAMQRFARSGRVEDAASVFRGLLDSD
jgi:hypothetical protein